MWPTGEAGAFEGRFIPPSAGRYDVRVTVGGGAPNGDSSLPSISGDGRYVVFVSEASNLLNDDENHASDVLLYDRETDALRWVSRGADGASANGESTSPVISADGRFVAFQSDASNLVCAKRCPEHDEDVNLVWDVFLFDRVAGRTARLSCPRLGSGRSGQSLITSQSTTISAATTRARLAKAPLCGAMRDPNACHVEPPSVPASAPIALSDRSVRLGTRGAIEACSNSPSVAATRRERSPCCTR